MIIFLVWIGLGMVILGLLGNILGLAAALAFNMMLLGVALLAATTLWYWGQDKTPPE